MSTGAVAGAGGLVREVNRKRCYRGGWKGITGKLGHACPGYVLVNVIQTHVSKAVC